MNENIIESLIQKAYKSQCRFRVAAAVFDRRWKLLSLKSNAPRFDRYGGSVHAEMAALKEAGKTATYLILCRVGHKGAILDIHPCKTCQRIINKYQVKVILLKEFKA